MKIRCAFTEKINRNHKPIYTIAFDASVQEAAQMMYKEKIGAMLVEMPAHEDGVYAGIISERDIINSCANYTNFETLPVSKVMSKQLITADVNEEIKPVAVQMQKAHIRHIPVVEGDKIIALLSIRDLMYCIDMQREMTLSQMSDMFGSCSRNKNY